MSKQLYTGKHFRPLATNDDPLDSIRLKHTVACAAPDKFANPLHLRTLEETAIILQCTRERVRQIEAKAMRKLRIILGSKRPAWMECEPMNDVEQWRIHLAKCNRHSMPLIALKWSRKTMKAILSSVP